MKKKCTKATIFFILFSLLFTIPCISNATSYDNTYNITNYNIDMIVNENNTFDITEKIDVEFFTRKHGIFRKIPTKNTVVRNDGTTSKNNVRITNIRVNENYTLSKEKDNQVIKIGDSKKTITGNHSYTIQYTYDIGKDPLKDLDELYYNLIGNEWDTQIDSVSFRIKMYKPFDKSTLGFSSGLKGSTDSSNITYSVEGNEIRGVTNNVLRPGNGLTIRLTLPEDYFVGENIIIDFYPFIIIALSIIGVIISYLLWAKYGKDNIGVETVEFYPPQGYNSAEIGMLYWGEANNQSIMSLLIYLADRGYVKIEETEEQGFIKKSKGFRITKLKEYDGKNKNEKVFFDGLFKYCIDIDIKKAIEIEKAAKTRGTKISMEELVEMSSENADKDSVTEKDLYDRFYLTVSEIKNNLNSKEIKNRIFEASATKKIVWPLIMMIIIFILITVKPIMEYGQIEFSAMFFALLFIIVGLGTMIGSLVGIIKIPKIFASIWGIMFGGIPWLVIALPTITQDVMYMIMNIVGIVAIVIIAFFTRILPKRTQYGSEMLRKIKGFRNFLITAERNQLEMMVTKNPAYFYHILPYTYALGVSDEWIKQFETITMQAPTWYDANDFNMHSFHTFMSETMQSATTAMTSSPSSGSSSGGSSGGGSSGGGSGGGGGGSW